MNFRKIFIGALCIAIYVGFASFPAQASSILEKDRISWHEAKGTWSAGEADVVEFFSYSCSYCREAEKAVDEFIKRKPANVTFQRYAISATQPGWAASAAAFRAAHLGGVENVLRPLLFDRMHQREGFANLAAVREFFELNGQPDAAKFLDSNESVALKKHIFALAKGIQLEKTPTFVVGGKYIAYWGTHQSPQEFAELLLALHQKASQKTPIACTVKPSEDEGAVDASPAACR